MSQFSSPAEDAIQQSIDVVPRKPDIEDLSDYFDIPHTADEIQKRGYLRVALQFPDELLHSSVPVYQMLRERLPDRHELYVLADTSYGSCCVDEVAAQHVNADAIVHYGHACMSKTYRLPVIFVFGKDSISIDDVVSSVSKILQSQDARYDTIRLLHDVEYSHAGASIYEALSATSKQFCKIFVYVPLKTIMFPSETPDTSLESDADCIVYVGKESLALNQILLTHPSSAVIRFDSSSGSATLESTSTNRLLMRRYAVVQKARDSDVFGIVVGTLGTASYLLLIQHIRQLLKKKHKKSYTISVGKLNPAKLANFLEIECFVLVACPQNSFVDGKEFFRPVITPFELEVALKDEMNWGHKYTLDFETILKEGKNSEGLPQATPQGDTAEDDADTPVFSATTGKYRHPKRFGATDSLPPGSDSRAQSSSLVPRASDALATVSSSAAVQFFQSRAYQGLELQQEAAPSILEQGRSGIARGYDDDNPT